MNKLIDRLKLIFVPFLLPAICKPDRNMKNIVCCFLLFLTMAAQAQTGDLAANKAKKALADYLPVGEEGQLLYAAYNLDADTFLQKINAFKAQAYHMIEAGAEPATIPLAKKDLDFFCLNHLITWSVRYGIDSVKHQGFFKMLNSSGGRLPVKTIDSAYRAYKTKNFTPVQLKQVDSLCYGNPDLNDSALFVYSPAYKEYLYSWIERKGRFERRRSRAVGEQQFSKLTVAQKYITNRDIREFFTYTYATEIIKKSKDSVLNDSIYHACMAVVTTPRYRQKIEQVWNNYITYGNNKPAPDFSFADVKGKQVTLKSLRGKYVYIDVWATWCGPCKKEIPHLTRIEEEYEKRNIHFVSLSVDKPVDKNKWVQYVRQNKLKGIQLITENAFDAEFIRKFNINSIPRFILIDPDGKIISADAKRPSDPALKAQLDGLL